MTPPWFQHLISLGRESTAGLLQLLYPGMCGVCGQSLPADQSSCCAACRAALTTDPHPTCPRCASTVGPFVPLDNGCTRCRGESFHFEGVLRLGPYEGLLRDVVLRMKNSAGEGLAELVGDLWAEHALARLQAVGADVLIPVPLHWRRRWSRGFNQSEILSLALASRLRLPCRPRWLRRTRHTPKQAMQSPSVRRENVRNAFAARGGADLRGKTVLLVDDVLTTGTTASEAARVLREAGGARIVVAVLAHD